jgi:hypothetical protein
MMPMEHGLEMNWSECLLLCHSSELSVINGEKFTAPGGAKQQRGQCQTHQLISESTLSAECGPSMELSHQEGSSLMQVMQQHWPSFDYHPSIHPIASSHSHPPTKINGKMAHPGMGDPLPRHQSSWWAGGRPAVRLYGWAGPRGHIYNCCINFTLNICVRFLKGKCVKKYWYL